MTIKQQQAGNIWRLSVQLRDQGGTYWVQGSFDFLSTYIQEWTRYVEEMISKDFSSECMIHIEGARDDCCRTPRHISVCLSDVLVMSLQHSYGPDADENRWWQISMELDSGASFLHIFEHESEALAVQSAWITYKTAGTDLTSVHEYEWVSDTYDRSVMKHALDLSRVIMMAVTNAN